MSVHIIRTFKTIPIASTAIDLGVDGYINGAEDDFRQTVKAVNCDPDLSNLTKQKLVTKAEVDAVSQAMKIVDSFIATKLVDTTGFEEQVRADEAKYMRQVVRRQNLLDS